MEERYMIKQTIEYSDGTETVLDYRKDKHATEIEAEVAEAIEGHDSDSVVSASEVVSEVKETTGTGIGE